MNWSGVWYLLILFFWSLLILSYKKLFTTWASSIRNARTEIHLFLNKDFHIGLRHVQYASLFDQYIDQHNGLNSVL